MIGQWLDDYDRSARLVPGLLALAPLAVAAIGLGWQPDRWTGSAIGVLMLTVGPPVLAKFVRERGRRLQIELWSRWGGSPVQLLLLPATGQSSALHIQRRSHVERVTGLILPRAGAPADPSIYTAIERSLGSKTGEQQRFPRVHAENKNYGFERNLLGIRPYALGACALSAGSLIAGCVLALRGADGINGPAVVLALAAEAALLAFWLTWPHQRRVRAAGDRFAEQLVDAASSL